MLVCVVALMVFAESGWVLLSVDMKGVRGKVNLKQRGLLDDTLVVWAGEFGRTPIIVQDISPDGMTNAGWRDHHKDAFSVWVAGGGFKRGHIYGETDELGCRVVRDAVHVHDLQATLLHQLGLDHERLTYKYQGRDFRLTDVHGCLRRAPRL